MFRLPLRSTLFPYTTLFRSVSGFALVVLGGEPELVTLLVLCDFAKALPMHSGILVPGQLTADRILDDHQLVGVGTLEDRKSTRLNSSHRCISYAVFCLKKKT